jgi:hypothetical protein
MIVTNDRYTRGASDEAQQQARAGSYLRNATGQRHASKPVEISHYTRLHKILSLRHMLAVGAEDAGADVGGDHDHFYMKHAGGHEVGAVGVT